MQISISLCLGANLRSGGAPPFSPASLFADGEQGAWYAPGPSTAFQDTAGTTPAGLGDPVGRLNDLSGNGNHATQATAASRPTLQQTAGGLWYLQSDGVDDGMAFPSPIAGADARSVVLGLRSAGGGSIASKGIYSLGGSVGASGNGWYLYDETAGLALRIGGNKILSDTLGTSDAILTDYWAQSLGPTSAASVHRKNGAVLGVASQSAQTVNTNGGVYGTSRLLDGDGDDPWQGRCYGVLIVNRLLTAQELEGAEAYMAARAGVTL